MTGYEIGIISDIDENVSVPFSECADICWHIIDSSDIPTAPFYVSIAGSNMIGVGPSRLCTENKISKSFIVTDLRDINKTILSINSDLVNLILNVTEFSKNSITLYSEIFLKSIIILCGENTATDLLVCAEQERVNNTVHLDTTLEYRNEYRPSSLYYYEVYTSTIAVVGFVNSTGGQGVLMFHWNMA